MDPQSSPSRRRASSRSSRRRVLAVGASLLGLSAISTGSGTESDATTSCGPEVRYWQRPVTETDADWSTWSPPSRYCSLPRSLLRTTVLEVGQQVRLRHDESGFESAAYTVASAAHGGAVGLTEGGLDRLGVDENDVVTIASMVVHPIYDSRQEARLNDEFVEYLAGDDGAATVVTLAPHGGYIEYGTDFEARRVAEQADGLGWICAGFNSGGGAFDRWHVTSTEIHANSFRELGCLLDRDFEWAVAFHGYTNDYITVCGTASESERETVANSLGQRLPDVSIKVPTNGDGDYRGVSPANILNRVGEIGRTIQIEQPFGVRETRWHHVADGVVEALEILTD
ncbi:poly-gamma-glutamate hydrolase family protein [Halovivax limisalsi]|uniref:poly-gamma-glutamate hydrolase family protein n=1 Tax=Halovivax limisalsi TaxID=1453760 RepID=UPI001FFC9AFC|nr:poly-gamma-glutamate hydrolase family protein [Halovivax limisalsi]